MVARLSTSSISDDEGPIKLKLFYTGDKGHQLLISGRSLLPIRIKLKKKKSILNERQN